MARFSLDEDIPLALADLLRVDGHTVTTTRDEHRLGSPNLESLSSAITSKRTVPGSFRRARRACSPAAATKGSRCSGLTSTWTSNTYMRVSPLV